MPSFRNLSEAEQSKLVRAQPEYKEALQTISCLAIVGLHSSVVALIESKKELYFSSDPSVHAALLKDPYVNAVLRSNPRLYEHLLKQTQNYFSSYLRYNGNCKIMSGHKETFLRLCEQLLNGEQQQTRLRQFDLNELNYTSKFISKTSVTSREGFKRHFKEICSEESLAKLNEQLWPDEDHEWTGAEVFFVFAAALSQSDLQAHLEKKLKKGYPVNTIIRVNRLMSALYYAITAGEIGLRHRQQGNYISRLDNKEWYSFAAMGKAMLERITFILSDAVNTDRLLSGSYNLDHLMEAYADIARYCHNALTDLLCDMVEYYLLNMLVLCKLGNLRHNSEHL